LLSESRLELNAQALYRFASVLIWLGVLAWVPFIFLQVFGQKPSVLLFLPVHLSGVVGGVRLRNYARSRMEVLPPIRSVYQVMGRWMILLGVMVWAPFFYLKYVAEQPSEVMNFLPFHLTGVLGGVALRGVGFLVDRRVAGSAE